MKMCNCWKAMAQASFLWGYLNSLKKRKDLAFVDIEEIEHLQKRLQYIIDIIERGEVSELS